ncbi:MAG: FAD-dependent thymidylate synthase [Thermoplasmatales archaeon]
MTIEAKIVCDSLAENGVRLTTFVLKYPRFIHSEFMTHRDFSRNASSSRAIPVKKQIEMVKQDMAVPLEFRKNKAGMQAGELLEDQEAAREIWIESGFKAIEFASKMADMEIHKQYANRILEPYSHISVVVSATRWANFFALRYHHAAQPEIAELARQMFETYQKGQPKILKEGEWHLPFVSNQEILNETTRQGCPASSADFDWQSLIKKSVARCARVSYLNHEGKQPSEDEDFKLYNRLLGDQPIHASPAEHQGTPLSSADWHDGNFHGWRQYRKTLKNEYIEKFKEPLVWQK